MARPDLTAQQVREQQKREYGELVLGYAQVRRSLPGDVLSIYGGEDGEDIVGYASPVNEARREGADADTLAQIDRDAATISANAARLALLRRTIKYHPYALRHAPPPSRAVEREAFLERIVQRELAPYSYEDVGTATRGRYVPPANDQMRYHFYNAADPSELHGRKFGQDHWTVNW
jgi:hypothetical protein